MKPMASYALDEKPVYTAAKTNKGSKKGLVFKLGKKGLGYCAGKRAEAGHRHHGRRGALEREKGGKEEVPQRWQGRPKSKSTSKR